MKKLILISIPCLILFFSTLVIWNETGLFHTKTDSFDESASKEFLTNENQMVPMAEELPAHSTCKWYGYWDHLSAPERGGELKDHVNFGKSFNPASAGDIFNQEIASLVSLSHTMKPDESVDKWRTKLRNHANIIKKYEPEKIPFILLQDEPLAAGFTVKQLENMVDEARSIIGSEFKYGFTFTRMHVEFRRSRLPQNADVYGINLYPFFEREYESDNWVDTERDFNREFSGMMRAARRKSPDGAKFFITGQAFSQPGKWREPPLESPLWYAKAVQSAPDIIGLMWFEWRDRGRWIGTQSMPELLKVQKEAFDILCPL